MKILCYIIYILIILVGAALSIFLPPSFALYVVGFIAGTLSSLLLCCAHFYDDI